MTATIDRFMKHALPEPNSGCWLWTGAISGRGYGRFCLDGCNTYAHRTAWALHYGPVPDDLHVLHKCDTPACVSPAHLFLGTRFDNMRDAARKGRIRGAGITYRDQIPEIRKRVAKGHRLKDIAADFGVTFQTISAIKTGARWGCL